MTTGRAAAGADAPAREWRPLALAGLLILAALPFTLNLAGDAQVHLAIAEGFASGHPFQYNPGGEIVVASTSPFWTLMLAFFYRVVDSWAPALLAIVAVIIWLAAGFLLYRAARDEWRFQGPALWGVVLLWLGHATLVANALGGLENGLSALQLLLLYTLTAAGRPGLGRAGCRPAASAGRALAIGLVLGWALLTRPDGGLFALLLFILWLPVLRLAAGGWRPFVGRLIVTGLAAAVVLGPWFVYQYAMTGQVLTDSSVARLYNGRQGALMLIPDLLYLHPKATISLLTAFLPLAGGFAITVTAVTGQLRRARGRLQSAYLDLYSRLAVVLLVVAGFLFYTFVVGAEAFGRYFLPLFPFFFLSGVAGLVRLHDLIAGRRHWAAALVALAVLFLASTSALDYYRRLGPGRFVPERALDVIYGPANRRYYSANVPFLVRAPAQRPGYTDGFLADLGAAGAQHVSIAVTEVQLRYVLDERVTVLSLDGRTSAAILDYVNPISGVPDFARYFQDVHPDYVHARQWCEVGGWLASVRPSRIEENLVCAWERRSAEMQMGDSFQWDGRPVTLVAPEIMHIQWSQ